MRWPTRALAARALLWIGGAWIALVVAALLLSAVAALSKLVTGDPGWEGVVMLPVASIFGAVVALPGALLLAAGLVLRHRADRREDEIARRGSGQVRMWLLRAVATGFLVAAWFPGRSLLLFVRLQLGGGWLLYPPGVLEHLLANSALTIALLVAAIAFAALSLRSR